MSRLGIKPGPPRWEANILAKSYLNSILIAIRNIYILACDNTRTAKTARTLLKLENFSLIRKAAHICWTFIPQKCWELTKLFMCTEIWALVTISLSSGSAKNSLVLSFGHVISFFIIFIRTYVSSYGLIWLSSKIHMYVKEIGCEIISPYRPRISSYIVWKINHSWA